MIKKMSLVNITGPRDDIDRMADKYLTDYEIHLENALKELSEIKTLRSYTSPNPYEAWLERLDKLLAQIDCQDLASHDAKEAEKHSFADLQTIIRRTEETMANHSQAIQANEDKHQEIEKNIELFQPFIGLDYPLDKILSMSHIKFRFGRFTKNNYRKFIKYIDSMTPSIFMPAQETDEYIYGVYFTPKAVRQRVDTLYYSLAWERIYLPEGQGLISEIVDDYRLKLGHLDQDMTKQKNQLAYLIEPILPQLLQIKARLQDLSKAFSVRKYAAITRDEFAQKETRYLLIGWMPADQALAFRDKVKDDDDVTMFIEDESDNTHLKPPTQMKNKVLFRPFELLTKMYGVPNYHEMDPTALVAISYSLLFGAMFGDLGQGFVLFLVGLIGVFNKKFRALGMVAACGLSSMIFGLLFGTVFGFEDVIPALWLHPMHDMVTIPFFGTLNAVFVVAVVFGMFIILMTMILNVVLRLKNGEKWEAILDKNGIAGLVFYGLLVLMLILYMSGQTIPATGLLVALLVISFLTIAFKEEIMAYLTKKHDSNEDGPVIKALTIFFESFETLLTYFSNTISFVRVGAFAISHGAMMGVVMMFAGAENSGSINWLVVILGNLFVMGFEGLIVAIQTLRLEFYEIFSHFYAGNGIEFENIWLNEGEK
ncbi:ATPase [Aerococcus urinaehominis]|uniref:ATPase n=1 Tax=Aerococcus urinaehominis TaxID=128944 RepID=A0A0X8FLK7_9LACT|nr:V-type ATPase 116kDa subunit family protein [Aerococcus urinaehominis]AMB98872.1 ATPase [Aerococcus urinaehominis]SDM16452.1 V/A-type H+-transporting ATPase subunit I [Aerococcus urinaehominis]